MPPKKIKKVPFVPSPEEPNPTSLPAAEGLEFDLDEPSIGMQYDGTKNAGPKQPFWLDAGIYCVRPRFIDLCPEKIPETCKLGMAGVHGKIGGIGRRLASYATAFASQFTILFVITYRKDTPSFYFKPDGLIPEGDTEQAKTYASVAEQECFKWLAQNGATRLYHAASPSEFYVNLDVSLARQLFKHMTDIKSSPIGPWPIPKPDQAYFFANQPVKMDPTGYINVKYEGEFVRDDVRDRIRIRLQDKLKKARKAEDVNLIDRYESELEALLSDSFVDVDAEESAPVIDLTDDIPTQEFDPVDDDDDEPTAVAGGEDAPDPPPQPPSPVRMQTRSGRILGRIGLRAPGAPVDAEMPSEDGPARQLRLRSGRLVDLYSIF